MSDKVLLLAAAGVAVWWYLEKMQKQGANAAVVDMQPIYSPGSKDVNIAVRPVVSIMPVPVRTYTY